MENASKKIITLKDINFGNIDGEIESTGNTFLDLFYTGNYKYNELSEIQKFIITGRKGTGKTILAKYYQNKFSEGKCCYNSYFKFNKAQNLKIIEEVKSNTNDAMFYEYFIYISMAETLKDINVNFFDFIKKNKFNIIAYYKVKKTLKELKDLYNERYIFDNEKISNKKQIVSNNETIKNNLSYNENGIEIALNDGYIEEYEFKQSEYFYIAGNLKQKIYKILKYIDIVIAFDDFDELDMDFNELLRAIYLFIETCKAINLSFKNSKYNSKCLLLIRDDILNTANVYTSNMNKTISDCAVQLNWIDNNQLELKNMVLNKIRNSNATLKQLNFRDIEKKFFKTEVFDYLLVRSFGRPRDIIHYLNIIRSNNLQSTSITLKMVKECELEYSGAFFRELENELKLQNNPQMITDTFNLIRSHGKATFSLKELLALYNTNKNSFPNIISLKDSLNMLYQVSAIGNYNMAGKGYFHNWYFRYNGAKKIDFKKNFMVHFGLIKYLNLQNREKERKNKQEHPIKQKA